MTQEIIFAGFGGQGILFAGKVVAYAGMNEGKNVSHLPSYGPEMRGGTANCSVIVSDEPVASPVITDPTSLVVMNGPSLDKFENSVVKGGKIFIDSTLISRDVERNDVEVFKIDATNLANKMGLPKLANIIMVGKLVKETGLFTYDEIKKAVTKMVPPSKPELLENNMKAFDTGYNL
ncbi:2-oxoacid:acceptor oxidoreductase family protein [Qingrenia yutianensis]|uniref:2-oxoacid:acceptor oxidoreductase family protein n=1 Tax=Qingrenia yutianensis TaxID=2763676 RepID=A0A926F7A4_9FIRM|nr:2-oxoacid:acceptor oxidoreductase family protein [Qingrenia yutianensis]MBC8597123.1 2-oxoacid:acceptor oxidoreductase family protein [Qingrenia yutianensis]